MHAPLERRWFGPLTSGRFATLAGPMPFEHERLDVDQLALEASKPSPAEPRVLRSGQAARGVCSVANALMGAQR